jgi:hypothetical protein
MTPDHDLTYLTVRQTVKYDLVDMRANILAGLVLIGVAAFSMIGLVTVVGLVGYGIRLFLTISVRATAFLYAFYTALRNWLPSNLYGKVVIYPSG